MENKLRIEELLNLYNEGTITDEQTHELAVLTEIEQFNQFHDNVDKQIFNNYGEGEE